MKYRKSLKIKVDNKIYQVFIREDSKLAYYKLETDSRGNTYYKTPSAFEFLKLNSIFTKLN